ncbi:DUF2628 domain-containing protein [Planktotalea frisia]|jgi:hypothetical protein|uniref:DUF2628 domain-containing protein n=1 Tax=Planktotalea frisia TaxID=696762 RepID=UPI0023534F98|nr:DUF2628 domain-containing protein [Planktotalea frisia]
MAELNAEQVPQKNEAVPGPLRVNGAGHSRLVQELALNAGDIIVAVNGILWSRVRSLEYAIDTLVEKAEKPVILTILRAGQFFDVITDSPVKNQTKVVMQEEVESLLSGLSIPLAPDSKNVSRYAVFTSMDHQADIVELRPSFSAMLFPPLWLVFRGLWAAVASFVCVLLTAFAINWVFGVVLYVALCVYVGRKQVALAQVSMQRRGMLKIMVLAASSELEAQNIATRFHEKLVFKFSPYGSGSSEDADIGLI